MDEHEIRPFAGDGQPEQQPAPSDSAPQEAPPPRTCPKWLWVANWVAIGVLCFSLVVWALLIFAPLEAALGDWYDTVYTLCRRISGIGIAAVVVLRFLILPYRKDR